MENPKFANYFRSLKLLNYTDWSLFNIGMQVEPDRWDALGTKLTEASTNTGLDPQEFNLRLRKEIERRKKQVPVDINWRDLPKLRKAGGQSSPFIKYIRSHVTRLYDELGLIPAGVEKAVAALHGVVQSGFDNYRDSAYEAFCFLKSDVSPEIIQAVIAAWKAQRNRFVLDHPKGLPPPKIFWERSREHYVDDGVARYRFKSEFGIGEFDSAFIEFESDLSESLNGPVDIDSLRSLAYDLCAISRSRHLVQRIQPALNYALDVLTSRQSVPYWEEYAQDEKRLPVRLASVGTTAPTALALLRLGTKDSHIAAGTSAATWLLEEQNQDGSWNVETYREYRPKAVPDLFTTICAMEAIRRSNIPGAAHSIERARKYVLARQDQIGLWEEDGFALPQPTVLILETLTFLKAPRPAVTDTYLSAATGYIKRSLLFVNEQDSTSRRLAIITAHLAIESFLYSLIQAKNITKFIDKGQTIGMRAAQNQLQSWLQSHKHLKSSELLPFSNELGRLAYLRDEIVHKAINITHEDATSVVIPVAEFMSIYSRTLLGFNCLG